MAEHSSGGAHAASDEGHMNAMDYAEHERTYGGFLKVLKWGTITVVIILALMGLFLT
ncbi:aa3-type cytochrome c oxidase subunit IV [Amorphus orientalis]|uniref:Cytochrome c oxidase subunit IV bacterial aa3 type domain-containing protein n=1 Tax=Amorphus orientalis TaxID=649198 RepID=A0AAE4AUV4_9HYPH|nr:aa3-type cytochrome c oxidase subunit IV [Amorphus orientalis]MDQ0317562.1 hypothetical protein [Amorphus orientalis]